MSADSEFFDGLASLLKRTRENATYPDGTPMPEDLLDKLSLDAAAAELLRDESR